MAGRFQLAPVSMLRHAATTSTLAVALYFTFPGQIDFQDTSSLVQHLRNAESRWLSVIEAAPQQSVYGQVYGSAGTPRDGSTYAVTSAAKNGKPTIVNGLQSMVIGTKSRVIPDEIAINRKNKGKRLITLAGDWREINEAAGSVYSMANIMAEGTEKHLPRVAFVKPAPLKGQAATVLASKGSNKKLEVDGKSIDLDQVLMARSAAAASFSLVSAYAPDALHENANDPFNALFSKYEQEPPPVEDPNNPHWWAKIALPASVNSKKEQRCLAEAVYFEARGETVSGQTAVAQVVLNRVRNPAYPKTICKVVYQNRRLRNRCQFSFACDGKKERITSQRAWRVAKKVATDVTKGDSYLETVGASTHYHATYVRPRWARSMNKQGKVGLHIFYKTKRGGWS
ncbi:MAG: cell wall hydrolase [Stappiaceae bacterium]